MKPTTFCPSPAEAPKSRGGKRPGAGRPRKPDALRRSGPPVTLHLTLHQAAYVAQEVARTQQTRPDVLRDMLNVALVMLSKKGLT